MRTVKHFDESLTHTNTHTHTHTNTHTHTHTHTVNNSYKGFLDHIYALKPSQAIEILYWQFILN